MPEFAVHRYQAQAGDKAVHVYTMEAGPHTTLYGTILAGQGATLWKPSDRSMRLCVPRGNNPHDKIVYSARDAIDAAKKNEYGLRWKEPDREILML